MRDFKRISIFLFRFLLFSPVCIIAESHSADSQQTKQGFHLIEGGVTPKNSQHTTGGTVYTGNLQSIKGGQAPPKNDQQTIEVGITPKNDQQTGGQAPTKNLRSKIGWQSPSKNPQKVKGDLYYLGNRSGFEVRKRLFEKGNPDIVEQNGNTDLHFAVLEMDIEKIENLLADRYVNIDATNQSGRTPLHLAILTGNFKVVKILVDNYANPNIKDSSGNTPLHRVSYYRNKIDALEALLTSKDLNMDITDKNGWTAGHIAVEYGRKEALKLYLEHGANPNIRDNNGETLLHRAVRLGRIEIMETVLPFDNLDVNIVNQDGDPALHIALKYKKNKTMSKLLIEKGAKIAIVRFLFLIENGDIKPEETIELLNEIADENKQDKTLSVRIDNQIRQIEQIQQLRELLKDSSIDCKRALRK